MVSMVSGHAHQKGPVFGMHPPDLGEHQSEAVA